MSNELLIQLKRTSLLTKQQRNVYISWTYIRN